MNSLCLCEIASLLQGTKTINAMQKPLPDKSGRGFCFGLQGAYPLMSGAPPCIPFQRCAALSRYVPLNVSGNAIGTLIGSKPLPSRHRHMEAYKGIQWLRDVPPVARLTGAILIRFAGRERAAEAEARNKGFQKRNWGRRRWRGGWHRAWKVDGSGTLT